MRTESVDRTPEALIETIAAATARLSPVRRLGWSFLLAWVFCVFYTDAVGGYAGGFDATAQGVGSLARSLYLASFPLLMSVCTLVATVCAERRVGALSTHAAAQVLAPVVCAAGTPLMFVHPASPALAFAVFGAGAVTTGVGSGLLWVMWGEYFSTLNRDDVELLAPVSGVIALACVLVIASTADWVAVALVTALPLLCGIALALCLRAGGEASLDASHDTARAALLSDYDPAAVRDAHARAAQAPLASLRLMGRANAGILVSCVAVCIMGSYRGSTMPAGAFYTTLLFAAVVTVAVAIWTTAHARGVSAAFLFRWMCPLLVAGIACVAWFPGETGTLLAGAVSCAARLAFCVFTQMYFTLLATSGRMTPTQSYGLGWIAVHLGDWVGAALVVFAGTFADADALTSPGALMATCLAVVCAAMFVLGKPDPAYLDTPADPPAAPVPVASETPAGAPAAPARGEVPGSGERAGRLADLAAQGGLTGREAEVLALLAQGRSVPYIRDELLISKDTVSTHVKHIYAKLGVHTRQELLDLLA